MTSRLPNWLRAGFVTGFFVALPTFLSSLIGWTNELADWATDPTLPPPDLSILRGAVVALISGAVAGGLNAAYRWAQEKAGKGAPPVYPTIVRPQTRRPLRENLRRRPLRADRDEP